MKTCVRCGIEKNASFFEHQKNRPSPRKICKQCRHTSRNKESERKRHREYMRLRRIENPEAVKRNYERSIYGATKEDFSYKCCWVCGSTKRLCIDHCHSRKKVRGLLCQNCNFALGLLGDDPVRIERLKLYVNTEPHFDRKVYP